MFLEVLERRRARHEPPPGEPSFQPLWQLGMSELEELVRDLDLADLSLAQHEECVPEPVDLRTVARRAATGGYRTPVQFVVDLLRVPAQRMSFEWQVCV